MTDIIQWRRRIQPARVRTPAVGPEDGSVLSPTTPRKGTRPKLSSCLTQHAALPGPSKTDLDSVEDLFARSAWYPQWSDHGCAPGPDTGRLMDSIMCKLLAEPYRPLDPRFNSMLMQIFESYQHLKDDKDRLHQQLEQETEKREALEHALHHASQRWDTEKQDYKAEVKRLELILAKGKRGLAEVTLARQDSVIRHGKHLSKGNDDTLETIFEFLEKTKRYEDRAWSSQRATMRTRSPSTQMRRLSRTLTKKSSVTDARVDMPSGRPPLANTSFLEYQGSGHRPEDTPRPDSEARSHISDNTLSTFSCAGDLLPDEAADVNLIQAAGTDNDLVAVRRIANVLAKCRHVDPDAVMPKLLSLFDGRGIENERSSSLPTGLGIQVAAPSTTADRGYPPGMLRKNLPSKIKTSGFLAKFRPQLHIDTSDELGRRFSFETGDDANASFSAPVIDTLPPTVRDRLIRKSASMSSLDMASNRTTAQEPVLSPVAQSPTTSVQPQEFDGTPPEEDDAKRTRIPTPVWKSGSLARPRRDRDDSASSLLTAIKVSRPVSQRSGSVSGSSHSSPSASRNDLTVGLNGDNTVQGSGRRGNALLHHTNSLRGGMAIAAAQKAANVNFQPSGATHGQYNETPSNNNRSSTHSRTNSDLGELRKENREPMKGPMSSNMQGDRTR